MSFNNSIIETIKKRKSVRTFENREIDNDTYKKIYNYLEVEENLKGPLGGNPKLGLVPVNRNITDKGMKIGTYGFIKNPQAYIVSVIENNEISLVELGYVFEKVVLYLTEINLGTCWLGGTFTRDSFEKQININNKEIIPTVTPIGYEREKPGFLQSAIRFAAKSNSRRPWKELFYYSNFEKELKEEDAGEFSTSLEMVRLGPSASNKQPWRIVLSQDKRTIHFYLSHTPNYAGNKMGFDMQRIDIGISMCHFELACQELNIVGKWIIENPNIDLPDEHMEYIVSFRK
ncbi:nitroreductase family protein [Clostridium sediminicola]|uniref:nitroreductase family protein n=1 Tax=Clostridium sediminicola TaxID=3114879 RepID=UPI0031F20729